MSMQLSVSPNHRFFFLVLLVTFLSTPVYSFDFSDLSTIPTKEQVGAAVCPEEIAPVNAPFPMPEFVRPVFPSLKVVVSSKGLRAGDKATRLIQQAIDQVAAQGGGRVIIPKGKWFTGRISLKSNVNLHLEEGAELHFSGEVKDYLPVVFTRHEGVEVNSLGACIYAFEQENIAITGKGTLYGPTKNGSVARQMMTQSVVEEFVPHTTPVAERIYDGRNNSPIFLPMFISPTSCKNVFIEGITLENTIFWNIVPVYCDGVIIRGVTVNSVGIPRGDGIDIESSKNVLIEYSTLNNGDDCFTIKSGRGDDGRRVNISSENIVIRHSLAQQGHGAITLGSETSAMIRNVYTHDCVFENTRIGIRFKTRRPRGGGGENIYYDRIRMNLKSVAFRWDMLGGTLYVGELAHRLPVREINHLTPAYRNIFAKNIIVEKSSEFVSVTSIPESPLINVVIENAMVQSDKLFNAADVKGFTVRNAKLQTKESLINLTNVKALMFDNVHFETPGKAVRLKVAESTKHDVIFKNSTPLLIKGWNN